MKRALKWLGIGVLSVVVLGVVLGIIFGEAEEQPAASVSTPTAVPTQAPEESAALKHGLAGDDYFYEGKYLLALTEFKMQQEVIPDAALPYWWIGRTHYELGSSSAAVDSYSQVLEIQESWDGYLQRGIAYLALGQQDPVSKTILDRALSDFDASLEQGVTGEAYFERAKYWSLIGESDKAAQDLVDARKLSPWLFK